MVQRTQRHDIGDASTMLLNPLPQEILARRLQGRILRDAGELSLLVTLSEN